MRQMGGNAALGVLLALTVLVAASCRNDPPEVDQAVISGEVYPGQDWRKLRRPDELGWSAPKLAAARAYARRIDSAAVMIVDDGLVVDAWGDIARNFQCHSMRKSLLSALYGAYADNGVLDLSKTLAQLNINDYGSSMTPEEKQATVGDLIKARSGVYLEALGESPDMKALRPLRHSHPPGTFWYYNNWDFNALGTIFEQATGENLFAAFERRLARPLRMQDFSAGHCRYKTNYDYGTPGVSMHRYYLFRMSARDLARIGLLYLREGSWEGRRILAKRWVRESTASHSRLGPGKGYGYMWWTGTDSGLLPNVRVKGHCYSAAGWGGHRLIVLPWRNLVIVHRVNTDNPHKSVADHQIGRLVWHLLEAAGETGIGPRPTIDAAEGVRLTGEEMKSLLPGCTIRGEGFIAELTEDYRFELGLEGKRVDGGTWRIDSDMLWLKAPITTGGRALPLMLALKNKMLSWYDHDGTLVGRGTIGKKEG